MTQPSKNPQTNGFDMTRQAFTAALKRCEEKVPLTHYQRTELWCALNGISPPDAPRPPLMRVNRWTREALALLEPLRREIDTCQSADRRGTIQNRYAGVAACLPGGGRGRAPLQVSVLDAFDTYCKELQRIKWEMENALREGGHWVDSLSTAPPEPLAVIAANERAEHTKLHPRHAGTLHWTQWAKPGLRKQLTTIFEQARAQTNTRGRCWKPYPNRLKG